MKNSHVHVVYGYLTGKAPTGEPDAAGFGRSDRQAIVNALNNAAAKHLSLTFYFVRSNGTKKPVPVADVWR